GPAPAGSLGRDRGGGGDGRARRHDELAGAARAPGARGGLRGRGPGRVARRALPPGTPLDLAALLRLPGGGRGPGGHAAGVLPVQRGPVGEGAAGLSYSSTSTPSTSRRDTTHPRGSKRK